MLQKQLVKGTTFFRSKKQIKQTPPISFLFIIQLIIKVGLLLGSGVFIPLIFYWLISSKLDGDTYAQIIRNINIFQLTLLKVTILSTLGQIFFIGILISIIALFTSHKIVGPLIRLKNYVSAIGDGNLYQKIQFRQGDQSLSLPGAYNNLCERVYSRLISALEAKERLETIRKKIENSALETMSEKDKLIIAEQMDNQIPILKNAGMLRKGKIL